MCGRFDVDSRFPEIKELEKKLPPGAMQIKLGEVFPGENALVIKKGTTFPLVDSMKWGFPKKDGKGLIFNARAETASLKPFFSYSLKTSPVLIPATGFYEWRLNEETGKKEKYLFYYPNRPLLYLAGFSKNLKEKGGANFTILTTNANTSVLPYHSRMPIIIPEENKEDWLSGKNLIDFLIRIPEELKVLPS